MLGKYLLLGNKNEVLSDEEVLEQINHLKSRKPPGPKNPEQEVVELCNL